MNLKKGCILCIHTLIMEIVKAFNENNLNIEINIKGTPDNPLFRASDVGTILDINTLRSTIRDFDETLKVVHNVHTLGGPQEVTFLTEFGLYELLFRSRKPLAKIFKKWVCNVIKEIRLNNVYKLKNESAELRNKLQVNNDENEKILLNNSSDNKLVYFGLVENYLVKFGYTKGIERRVLREHKKDFPSFVLKYTIHTEYHVELEESIKTSCRDGVLKGRRKSKEVNGKNQTELIQLDENFTIEDLYNEIIKLNEIVTNNKKLGGNGTILKYKEQIENMNSEIIELKKCLTNNGIELPKICSEYKVKTTDNNLEKYYLSFLEYFVQSRTGSEIIEIITIELYQQYIDFIKRESAELYLHCYSPFCRELAKCEHMITIRIKTDKVVDKLDNRIRGKKINVKLLGIWITEKLRNFNNTITTKIKRSAPINRSTPINSLEDEKVKMLYSFLQKIVDDSDSSTNTFKITNTELYNSYKSFSKLNDFSMVKFGSWILKCPGVTPIKNKIWFKMFNKFLCQEFLTLSKYSEPQ
jgi:prophage antirepressor-like protein